MCGIFGVLYRNSTCTPSKTLLECIAAALRHRGPDDYGIYVARGIGLVHTRLSLLDLNTRSNQPFWDKERRYCLVYNGEIYNYRELRDKLQESGVSFRTTSDTEVLLECLLHYDAQTTARNLQGMFAFGLFDSLENSLIIARDRFGIKPLYVYDHDDLFIFSSEIKAICKYVTAEPDLFCISSFLQGFTGGPTKNSTFFKNIRFVAPGTIIKIDVGKPAVHTNFFEIPDFWDPNEANDLKKLPLANIVDKTDELLFDSVKQHLIADAPVGGLCSGGVDSSIIMAMASKIHNNLAIFHANVVGPSSEYQSALLLAKHLRLDLKSVDVHDDHFIDTIPDIITHYEHPFCYHPNSIPFLKVSRLIRENGVKAVLSGEGSDECYLGYDFVVNEHPLFFYRRIPGYIQRFLQKVPKIRAIIPPLDNHTTDLLLHLHNRFEVSLDKENIRLKLPQSTTNSPEYMGSLDLLGYHLRTLLHRNDALGMAASVEARFPFLNHDLVKFAVNMPYGAKIRLAASSTLARRFLKDKWVIRKVARRYLPRQLSERQRQGFRFDAFDRIQISSKYFCGSPLTDIFELSAKGMQFLIDQSPRDLILKLFHLDIWTHVCLYGLGKEKLLNRLKQHIRLVQSAVITSASILVEQVQLHNIIGHVF